MNFQGIAASNGVAIGKVKKIVHEPIIIEEKIVADTQVELSRFNEAVICAKSELEVIRNTAKEKLGEEKAAIFDAHLMVLEDPELITRTKANIEKKKVNAEFAFQEIVNEFVAIFSSMDSEYMRERAADIKDVANRVTHHILGKEMVDLTNLSDDVVLVAEDLTPSDTATMDRNKVLGFLTDIGGKTSHSAIMARSMEIPAIVGLKDITKRVLDGDFLIFDGAEGVVYLNPSDELVSEYIKKKNDFEQMQKELEAFKNLESVTPDGHTVSLVANIGGPNDLDNIFKHGAEGIGLYRTEFLYMDRNSMPTEEEQFLAYKNVVEALDGKPVVIRTLDIGGDKNLSYFNVGEEMNPFLGYRAMRICLREKEIFKTQLRALYRASAFGNLKIMFPMISSIAEIKAAKEICQEVREELKKREVEFNSKTPLGMMIEIPAAAVMSDVFAKHVDFFSIGTNDLIQYTCAVDRMNEKISDLYSPFSPAVLRLIKMTIENGKKAGIEVSMCGEMAGNELLISVLLGLGLEKFSMTSSSILQSRRLIRNLPHTEAQKVAKTILELDSKEEIEDYLKGHLL